MRSVSVRIGKKSHHILRRLSEQFGESIKTILDRAIEDLDRQWFHQKANEAFAALRANPAAWEAEQQERAIWEKSIKDGLEER